jgi:PEP-CTERM motif
LENGYRWGSIPTITLTDTDQSNGWYALMASQDTDTWYNVTTGSGLPIVTNYGNWDAFGLLAYYSLGAFPSVGGTAAFSFGNGIQYGSPNMGFLVPEPSSFLLLAVGGLFFGWRRRNRSAA